MTTKTAEKTRPQPKRPTEPSRDEIQAAYECHTLAQILYGHIAATCPWLVQTPYTGLTQPMAGPHAAQPPPIWSVTGNDPTGWGL